MEDFRVIIAGGRDFNDYPLLKAKCDNILAGKAQTHRIIVVSGAAKGADKLGEQYAWERGYAIDSYPADWNTHGKAAGYIRNAQMANSADALIAFWDGKSHGTKDIIDTATNKGLKVRTIKYNNMTKEELKQHLNDIDYVINDETNEVIVDAEEIGTEELRILSKAMGAESISTKNGRMVFRFPTTQVAHNFGATMVEVARTRAIDNYSKNNEVGELLDRASTLMKNDCHTAAMTRITEAREKLQRNLTKDEKIDSLRRQTTQYAIEHITDKGMHTGIAWLRDSFNEYCKAIGADEYQPEDISFELDDLTENLKKETWVTGIAGKPADSRTTDDIDRIVNDFICKYWLMQPEEVTTKEVADVLKVADPLSHRQLLAQKVAIDCIHALDNEQLQKLDSVLDEIAKNPTQSRGQRI